MKGVLICGGKGERLMPVSSYINKHLLQVYNKPMFFYPLSLLLLCGCKEIFIIGNKKDFIFFKKVIKTQNLNNIKFKYIIQKKPDGISSAIKTIVNFFNKDEKGIFLLGDNFFYGNKLIKTITNAYQHNKCSIFISSANDPWNYGTIKKKKNKIQFMEKKNNTKKNSVITGLYILDGYSLSNLKYIKKSKRGEFEITDLLKKIHTKDRLSIVKLNRGIAWYDMGTFININKVSNLVSIIEDRQGVEIGNLV